VWGPVTCQTTAASEATVVVIDSGTPGEEEAAEDVVEEEEGAGEEAARVNPVGGERGALNGCGGESADVHDRCGSGHAGGRPRTPPARWGRECPWWREGKEGKGHTDGELEGVAGGGVDEGGGSGDPDGHRGAVAAAVRGRGGWDPAGGSTGRFRSPPG